MTGQPRNPVVLSLDDEAPIRTLVRVNCAVEGIDVIEAADGKYGLHLARTEQPDVVLLDVHHSGRDGWEVARMLREDARTRHIPVVFLTARAAGRDQRRGYDLGAVAYVTKPFNPFELIPLIKHVLAGDPDELRQELLEQVERAEEQ